MEPWQVLLTAAATVAASIGIFFFVKWAYVELKTKVQGYAYEAQIEEALLPYVYRAIFVAYRLSEASIDSMGERLKGIDKKKLALTVYGLLPDSLSIGNKKVSLVAIKSVVTPQKFSRLIETVFDGMLRFYYQQEGSFKAEFEKFLKSNEEE